MTDDLLERLAQDTYERRCVRWGTTTPWKDLSAAGRAEWVQDVRDTIAAARAEGLDLVPVQADPTMAICQGQRAGLIADAASGIDSLFGGPAADDPQSPVTMAMAREVRLSVTVGDVCRARAALIANAPTDLRALLDEVERLTAERDRLAEALRPFADEAGDWWEKWADDHVLQVCAGIGYSPHDSSFTVGDLRRARAALTPNT